MARPPATKPGQKTMDFRVSPGFIIGGFDGKRKNPGDKIALTSAQAKYFQKLGAITVDIPEFDDDDDTSTDDTNETTAGAKADGRRTAVEGERVAAPITPPKRASR